MSILETVKKGHILSSEGMFEPPTIKEIQNKINKNANNGKLNDFVNSLNWVGGRLKNRIMDIRII